MARSSERRRARWWSIFNLTNERRTGPARRRPNPRSAAAPAHPVGLEPLEGRQLLTAAFSNADFTGTVQLFTPQVHGTVVSDGMGAITGGGESDVLSHSVNFTGTDYALGGAGAFTADIATDAADNDPNFPTAFSLSGAMNAAKDIAAANQTPLPGALPAAGLSLLVKPATGATNADIAGTWSISDVFVHGSLTFNATGGVTSGSVVDESGKAFTVTSGDYTINNDGSFVAHLHTTPLPQGGGVVTVSGALNASKDTIVANIPPNAPTADDILDLSVTTKRGAGFANSDFLGTWFFGGLHVTGSITADGLGKITGGAITMQDGSVQNITGGTYSIAANGTLTVTAITDDANPANRTHKFTGSMNLGKNLIALTDATANPNNDDLNLSVLINSQPQTANLGAQLVSTTLPATMVPGDTGNVVVKVTNNGGAKVPAGTFVTAWLSTDNTLDNLTDTPIGTVQIGALGAVNGATTATIKATVPALSGGPFFLLVDVEAPEGTQETTGADNVDASDTTRALVYQFGTVQGRTGSVSATFIDGDGTLATFSLTGPGTGTLTPSGNLFDVTLTGTTKATTFNITTKKAGASDDAFAVHDITVGNPLDMNDHTSLAKINAPNVDILQAGGVTVTGGLGNLTVRDIDAGHSISVGTDVAVPVTAISARDITLTTITTAQALANITARDVTNLNITSGSAVGQVNLRGLNGGDWTATKLAGLKVTNDASFDLTLDNTGGTGNALGPVMIGGKLSNSTWSVTGNLAAVTVGDIDTVGLTVNGAAAQFTAGAVNGLTWSSTGTLAGFKALDVANSSLTAASLASLNIPGRTPSGNLGALSGDANHFDVTLNPNNLTFTTPVLGSASVKGAIANSTWQGKGKFGAVSSNQMSSSRLGLIGNPLTGLASLKTGNLDMVSIRSTGPVGAVTGGSWTTGIFTASTLTSLTLSGDLTDLSTTLSGAASGQTAGLFKITGGIDSSDFTITGNAAGVSSGGTVMGMTYHATGDTSSFALGDVLDSQFQAGGKIGSFTAWRIDALSSLTANALGTYSITGRAANLTANPPVQAVPGDSSATLLLAGANLGTGTTLGTAKIAGTLEGDWSAITGKVGQVTSGNVGINAAFTLGAPVSTPVTSLASLTAKHVGTAGLYTTGSLGAISATQWDSGALTGSTFTSLKVTGDTGAGLGGNFGAPISLSGAGGTINIKGGATGAWSFGGGTGAVDVGATSGGFSETVAGIQASWHTHGSSAGDFTVGKIAGAFTIDGDFTNAKLTSNYVPTNLSQLSIGSFTVGGTMTNSWTSALGSIGPVNVGAVVDSRFIAGMNAAQHVYDMNFDPNSIAQAQDPTVFFSPFQGGISSFTVKGINGQGNAFVNTDVITFKLGTTTIRGLAAGNAAAGFGFYVGNATSYSRVDGQNPVKNAHSNTVGNLDANSGVGLYAMLVF